MSKPNDGGSAYPYTERNDDGSPYLDHPGMTLRDFATLQSVARAALSAAQGNSTNHNSGGAA